MFRLVHGIKIDFFRSGHEFVFSCLLFFLFGHIITLSFTGKSMLKKLLFCYIFPQNFSFLFPLFRAYYFTVLFRFCHENFVWSSNLSRKSHSTSGWQVVNFRWPKKLPQLLRKWQFFITLRNFKWQELLSIKTFLLVRTTRNITDIPVDYTINCFIYLNINSRL